VETILDPGFMKKLERLRLRARRAFPGTSRGERRSTRRGASIEFSDFRKYEAGDDFRHVDWNVYARLERLMLRQFVEDEDVHIDILIDQSRSMQFGEPHTKFELACKAAAAIAFLAVESLDRVSAATFDSNIRAQTRAFRGRGHLASVSSFLNRLVEANSPSAAGKDTPAGQPDSDGVSVVDDSEEALSVSSRAGTDLSSALKLYQRLAKRSGIVFIISDFLDANDYKTEMKLLAHRGFDLNLIQLLSREELAPSLAGDLTLVDAETHAVREITVNQQVQDAYKAALRGLLESIGSFCRSTGIGYAFLESGSDFDDNLLRALVGSRMAE